MRHTVERNIQQTETENEKDTYCRKRQRMAQRRGKRKAYVEKEIEKRDLARDR